MKIFTTILFLFIAQILFAQSIVIENFEHQKTHFWNHSSLPLKKNSATIEFKTPAKGLSFISSKDEPFEMEEKDGVIIVYTPDKTRFIKISHPDYGELIWRVPVNFLKKHNHYSADLITTDLTKEFVNPSQWLIFNISPENSVLTLDSTIYQVRDGHKELYLPIGMHRYTIESPFYEAFSDSVILSENKNERKKIFLQPIYSYITVRLKDFTGSIFVNDEYMGENELTSLRLNGGDKRILINSHNKWVLDTIINIGIAEKRLLEFSSQDLDIISDISKIPLPPNTLNTYYEYSKNKPENPEALVLPRESNREKVTAFVKLTVSDPSTEIKIDRESMGMGEWSGELSEGFHLITTEKDGLESTAQYLDIVDSTPREINIVVPESSIGMVNLSSNVEGAEIWFDNNLVGITPCIIKGLIADENHTLFIKGKGYKGRKIIVRPKANNIIDVFVRLEKNKKG